MEQTQFKEISTVIHFEHVKDVCVHTKQKGSETLEAVP